MTLFDVLKFEEGYRAKPYYCSENYPTIGIGTKIGPKDAPLDHYVFTVNEATAQCMLDAEVESILRQLVKLPWYLRLDADRAIIIQSMCYQMGVSGVLKFKKMIAALERDDYAEAARQALDSRWARQTRLRASRHAHVLEHGSLNEIYEGLV